MSYTVISWCRGSVPAALCDPCAPRWQIFSASRYSQISSDGPPGGYSLGGTYIPLQYCSAPWWGLGAVSPDPTIPAGTSTMGTIRMNLGQNEPTLGVNQYWIPWGGIPPTSPPIYPASSILYYGEGTSLTPVASFNADAGTVKNWSGSPTSPPADYDGHPDRYVFYWTCDVDVPVEAVMLATAHNTDSSRYQLDIPFEPYDSVSLYDTGTPGAEVSVQWQSPDIIQKDPILIGSTPSTNVTQASLVFLIGQCIIY